MEEFIRAILNFPKYIFGWFVGLISAILSDVHITTLAVTGALAGLLTGSLLFGLLFFFLLYCVSRIVSNLANAIGFGLQNVAGANAGVGHTIHRVFTPPEKVDG